MQKKLRAWLLLLSVVLGGVLVYRYIMKTYQGCRVLEVPMDQKSAAMAQKFNEEKEAIADDLSEILDKMDDLDKDEGALRDQIEQLRKGMTSDDK